MSFVEKVYNGAVESLQNRYVRFPAGKFAGWSLGLAGGAGAAGVALGSGESVPGKVMDGIYALPNIYNNIRHWAHPYHLEEFSKAMEIARDAGPLTEKAAKQLADTHRLLEAAKMASDHFQRAEQYSKDWSFFKAYDALRSGMEALPPIESMQKATGHARDALNIAADYLNRIDVNPIYTAMMNFADNFSRDEIAATVGIASAFAIAGAAAGRYAGGFWTRRGRPSWTARKLQGWGFRAFPNYYRNHPEMIAGEKGMQLMQESDEMKEYFRDYYRTHPEELGEYRTEERAPAAPVPEMPPQPGGILFGEEPKKDAKVIIRWRKRK